MSMTMTQKILAAKAGLPEVKSGQLIEIALDGVLGNDVTTPPAISEFKKYGFTKVFDKDKIFVTLDHFTPNKDIKAAGQCKICRIFSREQEISNFFDVGEVGIEHALLPEKGLVLPGGAVIGADSHTCTYGALGAFSTGVGSTDMAAAMVSGKTWLKVPEALRFDLKGSFKKWVGGKDLILHIIGLIGVDGALYKSMEFSGEGVKNLSIDDRFTVANMAIEAGGKNGIFPVDEITLEYIKGRSERPYEIFRADPDAGYEAVYEIDLSALEPTVSFPSLPENAKTPAAEWDEIKIDQVVIGSCTNGRISDLATAAEILKGRKVAKNVRCIVIPATQAVYLESIRKGYAQIFVEAGAVVSAPTCGPCLGGHMGILAEGERAVSTTNRNFVGRMGHIKSEVYLASPAVAAASAVAGVLKNPCEL
ncbi:MAG: 3-isopropylmalate dehydratase large subunit [Oscillospiraceae bacterium]|jgi:3-isopropylmalate/(R)-2-methylmalate dehydratase large subunit|nr:3-isopropylmalate dehydratase large subunit [Oscillospiraceae bacterium]